MDIILEQMKSFIKPELFIIIPVLYLIGMSLKKSEYVSDKLIPMVLGAIGVFLSAIWIGSTSLFTSFNDVLMAIFVAVTQGILCAGATVYVNQLVKQGGKTDE